MLEQGLSWNGGSSTQKYLWAITPPNRGAECGWGMGTVVPSTTDYGSGERCELSQQGPGYFDIF